MVGTTWILIDDSICDNKYMEMKELVWKQAPTDGIGKTMGMRSIDGIAVGISAQKDIKGTKCRPCKSVLGIVQLLLILAIAVSSVASIVFDVTLAEDGTDSTDRVPLAMIVDGSRASAKQFPYAVSYQTRLCEHKCTMTLITTKTILGAAHCAFNEDCTEIQETNMQAVIGTIDRTDCSSPHYFSKINVFPSYKCIDDDENLDIATYILGKEVELRGNVKPIALLGRYEVVNESRVTVIGWGLESYSFSGKKEDPSRYLRYVNMEIKKRTSPVLIFGKEDKGPFLGDSGGPNVVIRGDTHILVAITKGILRYTILDGLPFSIRQQIECCSVDVRAYSNWIEANSEGRVTFITNQHG